MGGVPPTPLPIPGYPGLKWAKLSLRWNYCSDYRVHDIKIQAEQFICSEISFFGMTMYENVFIPVMLNRS